MRCNKLHWGFTSHDARQHSLLDKQVFTLLWSGKAFQTNLGNGLSSFDKCVLGFSGLGGRGRWVRFEELPVFWGCVFIVGSPPRSLGAMPLTQILECSWDHCPPPFSSLLDRSSPTLINLSRAPWGQRCLNSSGGGTCSPGQLTHRTPPGPQPSSVMAKPPGECTVNSKVCKYLPLFLIK